MIFPCQWCEADVNFKTDSPLHLAVRIDSKIVEKQVPAAFPIATCEGCGETYLSLEEILKLEGLMGGDKDDS